MDQNVRKHELISVPIQTMKASILKLLKEPRSIKSLKQIHGLLLTSSLIHDHLIVVEIAKSFALANNYLHSFEIINHGDFHPRQGSFFLNSLISGLANADIGRSKLTFSVYKQLVGSGFSWFIDKYTFPPLLKSCSNCSVIVEGRQIHVVVMKMGFLLDLYVVNSLLHMYGVCCESDDARKLFDEMGMRDVVSWTSLISGYVKGGLFERALRLFMDMDLSPNVVTVVSVLVACGRLGDICLGRRIHGWILKGEGGTSHEISNALLDMYVKCGFLDEAKQVFDEMPCRDILSWTSIITGYSQANRSTEALAAFRGMQDSGLEPDKVTLTSVLSACASLGAVDLGRWVHDYINRQGFRWDVHLGTAMVDMYSKSGCIKTALQVFEKMPFKNLLSWNALLGGLAMHGHGRAALRYYSQMIEAGTIPNKITFIAILSACSHSGLIQEGRECFDSISKVYNLEPTIEHCGCMVDLLGRAGLLEEACDLITGMPVEPDALIWGSLLNACKVHGNVEITRRIQNYLLEMESSDSGVYVLLSNIYATNNRWREVTKTRRLMKQMGIKKEPGSTMVEVDGRTHEFLVGDCFDHPHKKEILDVLSNIAHQIPDS